VNSGVRKKNIQTSLQSRSFEDLSSILGMHPNEINKYIQLLIEEGRVAEKREERGIFFISVDS
jgi:predicted ArsR family transcriptional regulator